MRGYSNSSKKKTFQKKNFKRQKKESHNTTKPNEIVETFKKRNKPKKESAIKKSNPEPKYLCEDEEFVDKVLDAYDLGVTSKKHRIISLKFYGDNKNSAEIPKIYAWEITALRWLSDKKNEKVLVKKNIDYLESMFGKDAMTNYAVPAKMKLESAPKPVSSRAFEKFIFMHDDNYLDALLNAPKLPIEGWNKIENKGGNNKYAKRVIMNVDGQVILGEIIKFETRQPTVVCPDERSGSSTAFNVYYRGLQDGKFNTERWDYVPLSTHKNKLDENGNFSIFGTIPKNTQFSHRHMFTFRQRLIFGKNNSADIRPLPMNENLNEDEKKYKNFDEFFDAFENRINFVDARINHYELEHEGLKYFGEKYCPVYSSEEKRIVRIPENFKDIAYFPDKIYTQMEFGEKSFNKENCSVNEEEKER